MAKGKILNTYHFRVEINKPDEKAVKYFLNLDAVQEAFGVSRPTLYRKLRGVGTVHKLKDITITQGKFDKYNKVLADLS